MCGEEAGNERGCTSESDAKSRGLKIAKLPGTDFRKRLRSGEEIPDLPRCRRCGTVESVSSCEPRVIVSSWRLSPALHRLDWLSWLDVACRGDLLRLRRSHLISASELTSAQPCVGDRCKEKKKEKRGDQAPLLQYRDLRASWSLFTQRIVPAVEFRFCSCSTKPQETCGKLGAAVFCERR